MQKGQPGANSKIYTDSNNSLARLEDHCLPIDAMGVNYGSTNIGFKIEAPESQKIILYEELM